MPPTERRTRFGVEVGLANPGGLAGEIRREVSEGQRQANAATGTARAAAAAGSADDRRLRVLELQNQALREQARLYRRAMGVSLDRRSSPGIVEARSRVLGREVRSEPLDAAARALFVEQQRLAAALQSRREQYRRQAAELVAAQRGVGGFFSGIAAQRASSQRFIGRGLGGVFSLPAYAQAQGQRGVSGFFDSLASQRAGRDRQLRSGFGNLFGGAAAPVDRVARSMGLSYEDLADRVAKSGKSLTEFIRLKTGATAAEARNEKQLKGLNAATSEYDQTNRRSNTSLRETGRVLRSLFVAFVGFQALRGIQNQFRALIDYQKQLQSVRLGVAEILLIGNRFRDQITGAILPIGQQIQRSFALATRASRELVEQSIKFGLPLDTLVGTFQTVGGLAQSAGVSFEDTLNIITQIGVVAQRLNIPFNQLTRSADNIFTGLRVQQTQLGVILGLNQSIVQQQIRQGTLGQFLLDRLRGVGETLPENLKTMEGITQSLRSIGLDVLEKITRGSFNLVQQTIKGIRDELDELRQAPNTLKEMRDSVTEYTKALLDGAKAVVAFVRENQTLINLLAGAFIGYRLTGRSLAGAGVGAAAGAGYIDATTAVALGLPLALGAGRRVAAAAGAGSLRAGLAAAFPGAARGAGVASALGLTSGQALALGGAITAATGATIAFANTLRNRADEGIAATLRRSGRVGRPIGTSAEIGTPGLLAGNPDALAAEKAISEQIRVGDDTADQLLKTYSLQRLGYLQGGTATTEQIQYFQKQLLTIQQEFDKLEAGALAAEDRGDVRKAEQFRRLSQQIQDSVFAVEPTSLIDSMTKEIDGAITGQRKVTEAQTRELDILRAQHSLAEQAVAARQELARVEQRALEEQERSLRIGLERSLSQQNLAFAQTTGQRRAGLQASITQTQARIGTTQQGIGLAEGVGDYQLAQVLQRQLDALQQALQRAQAGVADAEVAAARQAVSQADDKLRVEQQIADDVLPKRLKLERELINLQRQQASIRAAGAQQELQFAQRILEGTQGVGRLIAQRKADARARQDPNFNESTFAKQELEANIEENRARIQVARSQADLQAAQAQIAVADRELQIYGMRASNERSEAKRRIDDSKLDQVTAGQDLLQSEASRAAVIEQENQLYLEQLQRWRQINEEQNQFIGNAKQFLSDILQNQKFSTSLKNFAANITRNLADGLSNATINFMQEKAGGSNATFTDLLKRIGGVFPSGTVSGRIGRAGGGGAGGGGINVGQVIEIGQSLLGQSGTTASAARLRSGVGLIGAGSSAGAGAAGANFSAAYGSSSMIGGATAFSGAGGVGAGGIAGAAGAAGGASGASGIAGGLAGAAGAGGGLVTLAAIAAIAGTQGYFDGMRRARKDPRATADSVARAGREKGIREAWNVIPVVGPVIGKALTKATSFIKVKNRGDAAASGAATGAAVGSVVPGLGTMVGAVLGAILGASTFGLPTAGTQQARFLAPDLASIGLTKNVRFGSSNDLKVYTAFRGANARAGGLPASYRNLRGIFSGFGQAGKQSSRGQISPTAFAGLDEAIAASVLGASADLNLAAVDAFGLGKDITKSLTKDFRQGSFNLLAQKRRGRITQEQLVAGLGGLVVAYNDLTLAIDGAALAQAGFTKEGAVSLKALENVAAAAKTVIEQGLPRALTDAVAARSPIRAAQSLAETFTASFLDQLGRSLVESGGVQKALTEAVALSSRAADAFGAGDTDLGNRLLGEARAAFITGRNDYQRRVNAVYGPYLAFAGSLGVYGEGGLINPTGAGLPSFDTTSTRHVAGPTGAPSLSMLHGGEVIRAGAHDDAIAKAVNNLASAQAELAAAIRDGGGTGSGEIVNVIQIGDDVIERVSSRRVRRGATRGMRTPAVG